MSIRMLAVIGLVVLVGAAGPRPKPNAPARTAAPVTAPAEQAPPVPPRSPAEAAAACTRAFDAPDAAFDAGAAAAACGEAAAAGDAQAMQRLGLLMLAGTGTAKSLGAARASCTAAGQRDLTVAAGFCLAAIAREEKRAGSGATSAVAATSAAQSLADAPAVLDPAAAATVRDWQDRAWRGEHEAASVLCQTYFRTGPEAFDIPRTAEWCRRATAFGDARAMQRLGLMRIWGVGVERSGPQATGLCREAQQRDPAVSAAFCLAAVDQDAARVSEAASPAHSAYPQPWPAATDPGQLRMVMAPDDVLETMHTIPDGLAWNCRELIRWSRYSGSVDPMAFGRPLVQFTEEDYAALDKGALACAAAMAPYDPDGSERQHLAEFRRGLPAMKTRKRELAQEAAILRSDQARYSSFNAGASRSFSVMDAFLSGPQRQCIDAIRRDWSTRVFDPGAQAIEIRTVATSQANGTTVVTGTAQVIEDPLENRETSNTYSCTFDHGTIVDKSILPDDQPQLPSLPSLPQP